MTLIYHEKCVHAMCGCFFGKSVIIEKIKNYRFLFGRQQRYRRNLKKKFTLIRMKFKYMKLGVLYLKQNEISFCFHDVNNIIDVQ